MAGFKRIRGIRDRIPGGYVIGRIGSGRGAPTIIPFEVNADGSVGGGGGSGTGVTNIAIEIFASRVLQSSETIGIIVAPVSFTLPAGLAGSYAISKTASTATAVLTIHKITPAGASTAIGTITFNASATGTFSFVSDVAFDAGDRVDVTAPATPDLTLADVAILLYGDL